MHTVIHSGVANAAQAEPAKVQEAEDGQAAGTRPARSRMAPVSAWNR